MTSSTTKKTIKIDPNEYRHRSDKHERAFMKQELKVDKSKLFTDPIIQMNDEQDKKYMEMLKFCKAMNRCLYGCPGYIDITNFSSMPGDTGIRAQCSDCLNYTTDESPQAREHVRWLNKILEDYGMNFEDGVPKLVKHEIKDRWCHDCRAYHTKMEWYDYREGEIGSISSSSHPNPTTSTTIDHTKHLKG